MGETPCFKPLYGVVDLRSERLILELTILKLNRSHWSGWGQNGADFVTGQLRKR